MHMAIFFDHVDLDLWPYCIQNCRSINCMSNSIQTIIN